MGGKEEEGGTRDGAPGAGEAGGREGDTAGGRAPSPEPGRAAAGPGWASRAAAPTLVREWGSVRHEAQHCHFTQRRGRLPNPERNAARPGREPPPRDKGGAGRPRPLAAPARRRLPLAKPAADPRSRARGRWGGQGRSGPGPGARGSGRRGGSGFSYRGGAARRRPAAGGPRGSGQGARPAAPGVRWRRWPVG